MGEKLYGELVHKIGNDGVNKVVKVVPRNSATLEQYPQKTIHSDHVGMTKFKERDSGYSRISRELKRWIEEMKSPPGRAHSQT
jgi:hypothetical protein